MKMGRDASPENVSIHIKFQFSQDGNHFDRHSHYIIQVPNPKDADNLNDNLLVDAVDIAYSNTF